MVGNYNECQSKGVNDAGESEQGDIGEEGTVNVVP